MTAPTDFSAEDWAILKRTPTAVAMAAAYSQQDGAIRLSHEMQAGLDAGADGASAFPENTIIQALNAALHGIDESDDELEGRVEAGEEADQNPDDQVMEERSPEKSGPMSLSLAQQSMAILEATATTRETVEFKHWLYAIADTVTKRSKSGGFLGFGGEQVSEGEAAYLASLRDVIGLELEG